MNNNAQISIAALPVPDQDGHAWDTAEGTRWLLTSLEQLQPDRDGDFLKLDPQGWSDR
jgi:hypothetical protein